jgi:serine/threonine protein kinase
VRPVGFAPGTRLDRYLVEGVLGQGGMAIVYKVRHAQLGTFHALKVLNTPSPQVRDRMLREGRVQGAMRHPNIVPVTDLVEISGSPGLVMEFVDGPTLESLLERYRPTLQQADALATAILEGVAYAHRKGFIHRDLKPANVLLANSATGLVPKVTDFGLAKALASDEADGLHHTRSGMIMGTPAYMAPEQIRDSKHVDQRADVFSLGVMLYELVSGRKPFVGDDIVKLYTAITNGTYRPIQELVPNVPERMERAIVGALAIDRNTRIQDCDRLLAIWRGDQSTRRASTDEERKRAASTNTAVPDLPEPFFPEASGDAEKEITFHDDGPPQIGGAPTSRNHWLLSDLSKLKIATPDFAAIAPNSDVPVEPRVIFPVGPNGGMPSIEPAELYDESSFAPRSGLYLALGVVALVAILGGVGLLYAYVGGTTSTAAPIEAPAEPVPAKIEPPPAPAPAPPTPKPRARSGTPRTTSPAPPPVAPASAADGAPLTVEDVGIAAEGATAPVDTPPAGR